MRADPVLVSATRDRLLAFAEERNVEPITIWKAALGFVNPSVYRYIRDDKKSRPHPKTLAALNRWMDENADWRRSYSPGRPKSRTAA